MTITPTDDGQAEGDQTIVISGTATSTGPGTRPVGDVAPVTITVTDDDPDVVVTVSPSTVSEGAAATTLTIEAAMKSGSATAHPIRITVDIPYGADYAVNGTTAATGMETVSMLIDANQSSNTATVTLDPAEDGNNTDEVITITATTSSTKGTGGVVFTITPSVTVTIDDNDP